MTLLVFITHAKLKIKRLPRHSFNHFCNRYLHHAYRYVYNSDILRDNTGIHSYMFCNNSNSYKDINQQHDTRNSYSNCIHRSHRIHNLLGACRPFYLVIRLCNIKYVLYKVPPDFTNNRFLRNEEHILK